MKKIYLIFTLTIILFSAFESNAQVGREVAISIGSLLPPPVFKDNGFGSKLVLGDSIKFFTRNAIDVKLSLATYPPAKPNGPQVAPLNFTFVQGTSGDAYAQYYKPTVVGDYVIETDQTGKPTYSFSVAAPAVTAIENSASYEGISFSPNPVRDEMNVTLNSSYTYEISVSDMIGSKLITKTVSNSSNAALNTSSLPKGAYVLHLSTDAGSKPKAFKFVKE